MKKSQTVILMVMIFLLGMFVGWLMAYKPDCVPNAVLNQESLKGATIEIQGASLRSQAIKLKGKSRVLHIDSTMHISYWPLDTPYVVYPDTIINGQRSICIYKNGAWNWTKREDTDAVAIQILNP